MTETTADPRANEKRRRIIEAAWRLALKQGLRAATMEALAREAGVAKGTLYAHFPDKDAVFDGAAATSFICAARNPRCPVCVLNDVCPSAQLLGLRTAGSRSRPRGGVVMPTTRASS